MKMVNMLEHSNICYQLALLFCTCVCNFVHYENLWIAFFFATVYRFINCVSLLSVQIMSVICLADDVDSGLPFYQSLECFCCVVAELHTIWPVGEMFCSDLLLPVGNGWCSV